MLALLATGASAATQGTLGSTSTGSVSINASVPNRIQLTGLTDVSFLNQDPAVAAASTQNVCVWSNTSTKGYFVTATGSGTASAFTLANGALTVPYSVEWAGSSGQASGTALAVLDRVSRSHVDRDEPDLFGGPDQLREPHREDLDCQSAGDAGRDDLYRHVDAGGRSRVTGHSWWRTLMPPPLL